jgi:hypothetical protein
MIFGMFVYPRPPLNWPLLDGERKKVIGFVLIPLHLPHDLGGAGGEVR